MQKYQFLLQKQPKVKPDLKVLDRFKVIPESLAKYLPPEKINFYAFYRSLPNKI